MSRYTYAHVFINTYIHTYIHTYIRTYIHMCVCQCMHKYRLDKVTNFCTYVYIYIHIYIYVCMWVPISGLFRGSDVRTARALVYTRRTAVEEPNLNYHQRDIREIMWFLNSTTPQLPSKTPQIPSNRDHRALNRGTWGSAGYGKLT